MLALLNLTGRTRNCRLSFKSTEGGIIKKVSLGKGRIEAISDGIYAIAMTLSVLSINVDTLVHSHDSLIMALPRVLGELRHYMIAFLTLASFWIGQHYMMDRIKHTNTNLNWIIMLHLLLITLIPVTTDIAGNFDSVLAVQIFVTNLFLISVSIDLEYIYIRHHPNLGLDQDIREHRYLAMIIFPGFSVLVFFLAWPLKEWATLLYLLIPFVRKSIN